MPADRISFHRHKMQPTCFQVGIFSITIFQTSNTCLALHLISVADDSTTSHTTIPFGNVVDTGTERYTAFRTVLGLKPYPLMVTIVPPNTEATLGCTDEMERLDMIMPGAIRVP